MATLNNKPKLAAVAGETQEEHPRNGQSRNTSVPRINVEYITQVFEEIEGKVTKKLSEEFNRTESHILGALSKLDDFLLNPQIRTHSGTVPGTFWNTNVENQEPNEDRSQDDPHPEVGPSVSQSSHSIDSDTDEALTDLRDVPDHDVRNLVPADNDGQVNVMKDDSIAFRLENFSQFACHCLLRNLSMACPDLSRK